MEAVREPEVIRLYREDEVVELVANYLLSNKKHEQERQRKADKGSKTRFRAERLQLYSILIHCCLGEIH